MNSSAFVDAMPDADSALATPELLRQPPRGPAQGRVTGLDIAPLRKSPTELHLRGMLAPGEQRVGTFAEIPALLRECGVDPREVLARAALPADGLSEHDARIPFAAAVRLLTACGERTGRPDFGLRLASRWQLAHLGVVGELMASCATVGQALETFASTQWLNASGGTPFLRRAAGVTTFGYAIYEPGTDRANEAYDLATATGAQMLRALTRDPDWRPDRVQLSRPRPKDVEPYRRFFRAPIQFDAGSSLLQYASRFDDVPLLTADEARRRALAALVAGRREDFLPKLHRMVRVALLFGLSADDLAHAMFMSHRTLNRRLQVAGTNFREVLATVRFEVARQLLGDTALPVGDVAGALGYSEASAFVRAFRRWSGTTPLSWRESAAARRSRMAGVE